MGQLLEPIKIICYGPSLTKSIQLAQLQLVLIPVESLKDDRIFPIQARGHASPQSATRKLLHQRSSVLRIWSSDDLRPNIPRKTFHSGHAKVVGYHHQTRETPIWEVGQSEGENLERNHVGMKMR